MPLPFPAPSFVQGWQLIPCPTTARTGLRESFVEHPQPLLAAGTTFTDPKIGKSYKPRQSNTFHRHKNQFACHSFLFPFFLFLLFFPFGLSSSSEQPFPDWVRVRVCEASESSTGNNCTERRSIQQPGVCSSYEDLRSRQDEAKPRQTSTRAEPNLLSLLLQRSLPQLLGAWSAGEGGREAPNPKLSF